VQDQFIIEEGRSSERMFGSVTALRADFVAKPEAIGMVRIGIEERILTSWGKEQGFLNGMVLVSDQEARLTTLITFWKTGTLERTREQKLRWLKKILNPYVDRCLSVQTDCTYFLSAAPPAPSEHMPARTEMAMLCAS
jgi:hypothetical protein